MSEISLPTFRMREAGQQMISETNNLLQENTTRAQQLLNTYGRLPAPLQYPLDSFLNSLQRNLLQVLALRQNVGEMLIKAAETAETTDTSIAQGFEEH